MFADSISSKDRIIKLKDKVDSAFKNGIHFNLSLTEFDKLFTKHKVCYYSGEEFDRQGDVTLERLNPHLGYTKGNVVLCKSKYNSSKSLLDAFIKQDISLEMMELQIRETMKTIKKAKVILKRKKDKELEDANNVIINAAIEAENNIRIRNEIRETNLSNLREYNPRRRFGEPL